MSKLLRGILVLISLLLLEADMLLLLQYFLPLTHAIRQLGTQKGEGRSHQERGDPITVQLSCRGAKHSLLSITHPCGGPEVRTRPFSRASACPEEPQPEETRRQESTDSPCLCHLVSMPSCYLWALSQELLSHPLPLPFCSALLPSPSIR